MQTQVPSTLQQGGSEMLSVIPEDQSKDAWIATFWKQEWEEFGPTRVHRHISEPGEGVKGEICVENTERF